jgi:hypothetical protein
MTLEPESTGLPGGEAVVDSQEAEVIRGIERQRLQALVQGNIDVARQLHSDDFELINPGGRSLSKEQYLGGIASGQLKYLLWEPDEIHVRLYGDAAVIRYQSQIQIRVSGNLDSGRFWHTDSYEKRYGQWQAVWSQATRIP